MNTRRAINRIHCGFDGTPMDPSLSDLQQHWLNDDLKDGIVEGVVVVFALGHSRRTMSYGNPSSQRCCHSGGGCNCGGSSGYVSEASTTLASSDSNFLPRARDERVLMYVPIRDFKSSNIEEVFKHLDVYVMCDVSIKFAFGDVYVDFSFLKYLLGWRGGDAIRIIYYTLVDYKNVHDLNS